jgi:hypothetical protein
MLFYLLQLVLFLLQKQVAYALALREQLSGFAV